MIFLRRALTGSIAAAAFACFAVPGVASSAEVYCVNVSGGDCTQTGYSGASGFQQALDDAADNVLSPGPDTVRLGAQSYVAPLGNGFNYSSGNAPVAIRGSGQGQTTIAMQTPPSVPVDFTIYDGLGVFAPGSSVSDVTVSMPAPANAANTNQQYRGLEMGTGAAVANVRIEDAGQQLNGFGLTVDGGVVGDVTIELENTMFPPVIGISPLNESAQDLVVRDSAIEASAPIRYFNSTGPGMLRVRRSQLRAGGSGAGVRVESGTATVESTRLRVGSSGAGVSVEGGTATVENTLVDLGSGFNVVGLRAANFEDGDAPMSIDADHVTIVGGGPSSIGVHAVANSTQDGADATADVSNTVIDGPGVALSVEAGQADEATLTTRYSNYDPANNVNDPNLAPPPGVTALSEANRTTLAPGFVGAANFHLGATSPLIDAGVPAAPAPGATDIDGNARALDGDKNCVARRDIGADEFVPAPPPPDCSGGGPPPNGDAISNEFSFGKVKKNRKRGTAKLTVNVPGGGELELAKSKKVKAAGKRAEAPGDVRLPIKPKGKAKRKLNDRGKAKVKAAVTFTPDGGEPNIQSKRVRLVKRR